MLISRTWKTFTREIFDKGYDKKSIKTQIQIAGHLKRSSLLNKPQSLKKSCIPLSVTYNLSLANLMEIADKNCHILNVSDYKCPDYTETLKTPPMIAFRKIAYLKE